MKWPSVFLALLFALPLNAQDTGKNTPITQKPKAIKVESQSEAVKENFPVKAANLEIPNEPQTLFDTLTMQEKLAQTIFIATDIDNADKYKDAIQKGLVGGVLIQWGNYSLSQTKKLIDKLQSWAQKSPHKIPLLISIDYEGGTVYTPVTLGFPYLPTNMMLAASQNTEDTATLFYIVASELKNVGVHINFAPVVDVNINPANPIIGVRSFGSDAKVVGDMGSALIDGLQKGGIMAVAKHFPGHGETVIDSHLDLPRLNMTKEEFYTTHIPPFKQAIDNGVMGVMTAHIVYDFIDPDNPATFSKKILNDLLKEELGFKGIIISDSLDMAGATKGSSLIEAASKALNAGVDMILTSKRDPKLTHKQLMQKVGEEIPEERINDAAKKIFDLKFELGLFDKDAYHGDIFDSIKAFDIYAGKIAEEAVTVVRAQPGVLPYTKNLTQAASDQLQLTQTATKSAETKKKDKTKLCSVFFSPSRFADQLPIINAPFLEKGWEVEHYNAHLRPKEIDIRRAKKCMSNADLVILGSLQWADKPIPSQKRAIEQLLKEDKDIIFLSLMSPYDIKFYPQAKNVIAIYGVNKLSAHATAEIILGNKAAKGKLPIKL